METTLMRYVDEAEARKAAASMRGWDDVQVEETDDGEYIITAVDPYSGPADRVYLRADGFVN